MYRADGFGSRVFGFLDLSAIDLGLEGLGCE